MPVHIFHNSHTHLTPSSNTIKLLIKSILRQESLKTGNINIIFTCNEEILSLNSRYLNRNYHTDVIAFYYSESGATEGDVFISLDQVHENSIEHGTGFQNELVRVIIHGILHLAGYRDTTNPEREVMHHLENRYLEYYHRNYL